MRVLFSTTAGAGHFGPLVPFARACADAGHDVLVAAPGSFAAAVRRAGFAHAPFADVPGEAMGEVFGRLPGLPHDEANAIVAREVFARLDAQAALPALTATIESWRPDVVVREPCEFGSWAAAECAGAPQAVVWIGLAGLAVWMEACVGEPLAELRRLTGLAAVGDGAFAADASFTLVPASFDDADTVGGQPLAIGAGVGVEGGVDGASDLPGALSAVLSDASYRTAAERVAAEIESLPDTSAAVADLERIADRQPA